MKHIVTKEIKSETQVVWILYLQDAAFLFVWIIFILMLQERVHDVLQIPYLIFSAGVGIRMVVRAPQNPKRRYYQAIALFLSRPKSTYRYYKEKKDDEGRNQTHHRRHTYNGV